MTDTFPFPPGSKLAAYLRDSGGDKQEASIPRQRAEIARWCEAYGYHLTREFVDEARSGGSTAGREAFLRMIAYFGADVPEAGVVFWMYSRFGRSIDDNLYYLSELRRRGVGVYSIEDPIPQGKAGRVVEVLKLYTDDIFRETLARNVISGHKALLLQHKCTPYGTTPAGYRRVKTVIGHYRNGEERTASRLEPDPETAPLVRKAFELRAQGKTAYEIHAETRIYKTIATYYTMFKRRIYRGELQYRDVIVNDFCEPLVDEQTWQAAQTGNPFHPRSKRSGFLLSGLLACDKCGSTMYAHTSNNDYRYYRCQNRNNGRMICDALMLPEQDINDAVLETVRAYILRPDTLAEANRLAREMSGAVFAKNQEYANSVQANLQRCNHAIGRVTAAIRDIGHSAALLDELRSLERTKADLEIKLADAQAEAERAQKAGPALDFDDIRQLSFALLWALDNATLAERQEVLRSFIVEVRGVRADDGTLSGTVTYRIPSDLGDAGTFTVLLV